MPPSGHHSGRRRRASSAVGKHSATPAPWATSTRCTSTRRRPRDAGYDGLVAPPTFVGHAVVEGGTLDDLREDGLWRDRGGTPIRLHVSRTMFGGEEWEFRAPVLVGDTITAQRRLGAVEEKDGRSGPFVLLHYETTFTNQRDEVVAISRLVGIAR